MHDAYSHADYLTSKLARLCGPELADSFKHAAHGLIKSRLTQLTKPKLHRPKRKKVA